MIPTALPYYNKDGYRIMFRGAENFGEGSYDQFNAMHLFSIRGKFILPFRHIICIPKEDSRPEILKEIDCDALRLRIFEN